MLGKITIHPSVEIICRDYFTSVDTEPRELEAWHFCDNEKDANECLELTLQGVKKATTSSLLWYQKSNTPLPETGDLNVVTDWAGVAHCVIRTTSVAILPFIEVSEGYAEIEGEGDKSLAYWRRVHWDFYTREFAQYGATPTEDMLVVCETFELVCRNSQLA